MDGARRNSTGREITAKGRTPPKQPRVLIIVENLPVPLDRRVWQEATALRDSGYGVSVICPKSDAFPASYEELEGIHIYRHPLPIEASGAAGYLLEYSIALFWEFFLSLKVLRQRGFDVIHACNPPDLIFLIGAVYKLFAGKRFIFDHHDINPELYETKFNRRGLFHKLMILFERWTFRTADASLATNHVFKDIAVSRGGMAPEKVWIVRSFPDLARFRRVAPDPKLKNGRRHLIGYVGVMATQDGVDRLIHAMHHIVSARGRTDIGCLIIGNGPEYENLKRLTHELGLDGAVHFSGFLTGGPLMTHLSTIDVGVIPDPWTPYNDKISMNKVFEYMSLGIPFVQYDLTVSRETAGEAAVNVGDSAPSALGDAIVDLVDAPDRRDAMAAYGRRRALETCNWEVEKRNLVAAYEFVFNRGTRPVAAARRSA
jgi:glycosyltransferase involved in cell wall biosynthesis